MESVMRDLVQSNRSTILNIAARYGVSNVRVFGSSVRDEARPESDIDLLVTLAPKMTLFDYVGLKQDLEDVLGVPVDLASETELHPRIRDRVLREAVSL